MNLLSLSHGARLALASSGAAAVLGLGLVGCQGSSGGDDLTVAGDVPLAYAMRSTAMSINPTDGTPSAPGGDLFIREKSSPSAKEHNLTARFTQGQGDVMRPEVSYDAKKIVFAMRCPTTNTSTIGGVPACTGRWNIWEYDMTGTSGYTDGSFRRLTSSTEHDDVTPTYLPGSRGYVFSSNRQTSSRTEENGETFFALDEYERERVLNLHTMDADGGNIKQISVNQSHDRNPVVRPDGTIMFSRWEHVGPRNRFAIFTAKPDGTGMFVMYGAQSPGNSFLHPRDMDPQGKYKGFVSSSLMSLSGTQEGGSLMFIDAANYSENNTPGQPFDQPVRRPGRGHRGSAQPGARPVTQGPHHQSLPVVGRHRPRAGGLPAVRGREERRRGALRHAELERNRAAERREPHPGAGGRRSDSGQRARVLRHLHV